MTFFSPMGVARPPLLPTGVVRFSFWLCTPWLCCCIMAFAEPMGLVRSHNPVSLCSWSEAEDAGTLSATLLVVMLLTLSADDEGAASSAAGFLCLSNCSFLFRLSVTPGDFERTPASSFWDNSGLECGFGWTVSAGGMEKSLVVLPLVSFPEPHFSEVEEWLLTTGVVCCWCEVCADNLLLFVLSILNFASSCFRPDLAQANSHLREGKAMLLF